MYVLSVLSCNREYIRLEIYVSQPVRPNRPNASFVQGSAVGPGRLEAGGHEPATDPERTVPGANRQNATMLG
eukprot:scaffold267380_cov25-Prasinocladus_malaysianus.AAC.1